MRTAFFVALIAATVPAAASAATCEQSFAKRGSVLSGLNFTAQVDVADLTPASAIGQMRGAAVAGKYDVILEEADAGSLLIEQPAAGSARRIPIVVTATQTGSAGTVRMEVKMPAGMSAPADGVRAEVCGMLSQLKGGRAGLAAAAQGMGAKSVSAPIRIDAVTLSTQFARESLKNDAALPLRYKGKAFSVWGSVNHVMKDGEYFRVAFDTPEARDRAIRFDLPGDPAFMVNISCLMAKGQNAYALTLKKGALIRLTGTFFEYDTFKHTVWLNECRPSN
ncbi:hypothetical protein [Phenylobacterium sp.]|uniref:hypothetical protein n=1 Tax=Phenylobacterium sp. TaxID=1871053 RepID=UPI0025EE161A|nr:hypothetical protein [Phenylobacterium sp.]